MDQWEIGTAQRLTAWQGERQSHLPFTRLVLAGSCLVREIEIGCCLVTASAEEEL